MSNWKLNCLIWILSALIQMVAVGAAIKGGELSWAFAALFASYACLCCAYFCWIIYGLTTRK